MCMEVLSELERSSGVSGFVERARMWLPVSPIRGSFPVPPQLLACCSPFPGDFSGESRMTNSSHNPLQHKRGSNLAL